MTIRTTARRRKRTATKGGVTVEMLVTMNLRERVHYLSKLEEGLGKSQALHTCCVLYVRT